MQSENSGTWYLINVIILALKWLMLNMVMGYSFVAVNNKTIELNSWIVL